MWTQTTDNLKSNIKILAHRPLIKGTKPLFIVIIIITDTYIRTYTEEQNKTKQGKGTQENGSNADSWIDFLIAFSKLNSPILFPNGHISRFYFVPTLSNLVGKVLLCARNFPTEPEVQFTNLVSSKRFQRLLFGKETVKSCQIRRFRFRDSDRNCFFWVQIGKTITWIRN